MNFFFGFFVYLMLVVIFENTDKIIKWQSEHNMKCNVEQLDPNSKP